MDIQYILVMSHVFSGERIAMYQYTHLGDLLTDREQVLTVFHPRKNAKEMYLLGSVRINIFLI
jgi:hypothetical protein